MSVRTPEHVAELRDTPLQSRVGRTYWVRPNANSTYQFVRFGDENTPDSIAHGTTVKGIEMFTVIRLSASANVEASTYQVRFANGTLKWMNDSAFEIHLVFPGTRTKLSPEIFELDPRLLDARLQGAQDNERESSLGPDPTKPSCVSFGMTEQQVRASDWGKRKPAVVTTDQRPTGTVDLWWYSPESLLAFRNGHLEEVMNGP